MERHVYEEGVFVGCCECVGVNGEEAGQQRTQASIYNRSGQLFGLSLASSGQLFSFFLAKIYVGLGCLRTGCSEAHTLATACFSSLCLPCGVFIVCRLVC